MTDNQNTTGEWVPTTLVEALEDALAFTRRKLSPEHLEAARLVCRQLDGVAFNGEDPSWLVARVAGGPSKDPGLKSKQSLWASCVQDALDREYRDALALGHQDLLGGRPSPRLADILRQHGHAELTVGEEPDPWREERIPFELAAADLIDRLKQIEPAAEALQMPTVANMLQAHAERLPDRAKTEDQIRCGIAERETLGTAWKPARRSPATLCAELACHCGALGCTDARSDRDDFKEFFKTSATRLPLVPRPAAEPLPPITPASATIVEPGIAECGCGALHLWKGAEPVDQTVEVLCTHCRGKR